MTDDWTKQDGRLVCLSTTREYPLHRGPEELVQEQVERTPDATALVLGAERLSYKQLNAKANRLAHFLRHKGVKSETIVGVCLDRSLDSIISILAILKAGGVYLPLDPQFPAERLAFMIEDSEAGILLTDCAGAEIVSTAKAEIVRLDKEQQTISEFPETNFSSDAGQDNLAYLIYTSGSTGKPKGVMLSRSALLNFLLSMAEAPGMSAADILLAVTTASFDISILEFLLPLICGAQIVVATSKQKADVAELQRLLEQHAITVMQATPTTWRMLIESGWQGKSDLRVLCGGEALPADLAAQLLVRCSELWNMYGPTETTIWSSTERVLSAESISIGKPIANTQFYVLDENLAPVAPGVPGELCIGGTGLARGYLKRPELTSQRFVTRADGLRIYRTGDEVRVRQDGSIAFIGRLDQQVKLHGFRIELGEIESGLSKIEGIHHSVVILREDRPGEKRLVAYYTGDRDFSSTTLAQSLRSTLPEYMIPAVFVRLQSLPLTPNGKLDRKALPCPENKRPNLAQEFIAPRSALEQKLAALWCDLLHVQEIGIDDSFFELGGNSLLAVRLAGRIHTELEIELPVVKIFQYPTIAKLASFMEDKSTGNSFITEAESRARHRHSSNGNGSRTEPVAVVGMAGRFPGAANLDELWKNLCNRVESISFFTPDELGPGVEEHLRNNPEYVRARGLIDHAEFFDAAFFGISPLEAQVMDPQQRVFLELAQEALENAGCDPERYKGRIGVFAGIGDNHYYTTNLLTRPDLLAMAGKLAVEYGNQKDYIALRAAYLLDFRGPAISLNTACSTTLLAIDQGYNSLLAHECDTAMCGGVDITVPQKSGFLYQEGGTFTRDGHCRPFDADATGTMFCDGAGIVILKRLSDALNDGDTIYALILGTGKNNNGSRPASFLAPSVEGQAEAIALAQSNANVPVESIGYIEAHGTGTPVGDPIEFEALRNVFESKTEKKQFCYIGSIKGNIGHPTNAAGVAGLIKAALVLYREQIPPTLHFQKPNPKLTFESSPFMMSTSLVPFPRNEAVRRTAVSSFGFGGTNVHAILEEAPVVKRIEGSRPMQLLTVSAKTATALQAYTKRLADHLTTTAPQDFPDVAFTVQTGRRLMAHRRFVVASSPSEAAQLLLQPNPLRSGSMRCERRDPAIVFMFGGQGTQYVNMGLNLYQGEPAFRAVVDDCCEHLVPHLGRDLRELLYPQPGDEKTAQISLQDTYYTQPSIFVIEYALARFWQSVGIQPSMMVGHSIGEFVAATLAGVMKLEDALSIIALRGKLMQSLPRGSMLAVNSSAESVAKLLPPGIQIASDNAPALCVASGPIEDVAEFQKVLEAQGIVCRHLHTSHAFHSSMMDPMIETLRDAVAKVELRAPSRPIISTVTGTRLTDADATSAEYWSRHARATVQFSKSIQCLKEAGYDLFLECGPRATLCSLARQQFTPSKPCVAIPSMSDTHEDNAEWVALLFALGMLWQNGVSIDWDAFYANEDRRHIALPTYPFERKRFWVEPAQVKPSQVVIPAATVSSAVDTPAAEIQHDSIQDQGTRKDRIAARIIELLLPVCGREASEISTSATFLEQGFDSLSLTQVAFAIRKEYPTNISFSQLVNQWPNVDMLSAHIDEILPAEVAAAPVHPPVAQEISAAATVPAAADPAQKNSTLEQVIAEQARTISRLVTLLEQKNGGVAPDVSVPALRSLGTEEAPHSANAPQFVEIESTIPQRGIYASSLLSESLSLSYNESVTLRFTGRIAQAAMARTVQRLVERHEALRARFSEDGMQMIIDPYLKIEVPVTDLSSVQEVALQEKQLDELISEEMTRTFSLPSGPLFRCHMVVLGADRAALILSAHHVICDGWSLDVLIHDACAFYSEEVGGAPVSLAPPDSYAAYVKVVLERQRSRQFEEERRYWHSKFRAGFPVLVLPADNPRHLQRDFTSKRLQHRVPESVVKMVRDAASKAGSSFFVAVLCSLQMLLARISRQRRFVIALPNTEQPFIGQPGLVGHCVGLLPFAGELRDEESVTEFMKRTQSELISAQDHSAFTLVSLLEDLRPVKPIPGVFPISTGLTSVKRYKESELPQSGFKLDYDVNPKSCESFEAYFNAIEAESELELHCNYNVALFSADTVNNWLSEFAAILQQMAQNPSATVASISSVETSQTQNDDEPVYALAEDIHARHRLSLSTANESPRTEAQSALKKIWEDVLGVAEVGIHDNFFELGGHSLLAVRIVREVERRFGKRLPLASLIQAPTIDSFSRLISDENFRPSWSSLVTLSEQGQDTPLFLFHSHGGNVLEYHPLARRLGKERPIYALQARGLDGTLTEDPKVEEMAAHYLQEIRQVQPHGPYVLGGFCFGGILAIEAAQQLRDAGEVVSAILLINAVTKDYPAFLPGTSRLERAFHKLAYRCRLEWNNLATASAEDRLDHFLARAARVGNVLGAKFEGAASKLGRSLNRPLKHHSLNYQLERLAALHDRAWLTYDPRPYDGRVLLLYAKEQLSGICADPTLGWSSLLTGDVQVSEIPGFRQNILDEPNVAKVAEAIEQALADVAPVRTVSATTS